MFATNPDLMPRPHCHVAARRSALLRLLAERQISTLRGRRTIADLAPFDADMMALIAEVFHNTASAA